MRLARWAYRLSWNKPLVMTADPPCAYRDPGRMATSGGGQGSAGTAPPKERG